MPQPTGPRSASRREGGPAPKSRAVRRRQSRADTSRRLPARTLRVTAVIEYTEPPIWRRLDLASDLRLDELHLVLQAAFGWAGGHLHEFSASGRTWDDGASGFAGPNPYGSEPAPEPEGKTRLGQVLTVVGAELRYTYDFGDNWEHIVTLEEISARERDAPRACVVDAERAAPPDDCGGVPGYEELLAALTDPKHPEHAEMLEWFGELHGGEATRFDPAYVDIGSLDRSVRAVVT